MDFRLPADFHYCIQSVHQERLRPKSEKTRLLCGAPLLPCLAAWPDLSRLVMRPPPPPHRPFLFARLAARAGFFFPREISRRVLRRVRRFFLRLFFSPTLARSMPSAVANGVALLVLFGGVSPAAGQNNVFTSTAPRPPCRSGRLVRANSSTRALLRRASCIGR